MSKSYKKYPSVGSNSKGMKILANRKVRRTKNIPNGNIYRRFFNQYDICEYRSSETFKEFVNRTKDSENTYWHIYKHLMNKEEMYSEWYKMYKRK